MSWSKGVSIIESVFQKFTKMVSKLEEGIILCERFIAENQEKIAKHNKENADAQAAIVRAEAFANKLRELSN